MFKTRQLQKCIFQNIPSLSWKISKKPSKSIFTNFSLANKMWHTLALSTDRGKGYYESIKQNTNVVIAFTINIIDAT